LARRDCRRSPALCGQSEILAPGTVGGVGPLAWTVRSTPSSRTTESDAPPPAHPPVAPTPTTRPATLATICPSSPAAGRVCRVPSARSGPSRALWAPPAQTAGYGCCPPSPRRRTRATRSGGSPSAICLSAWSSAASCSAGTSPCRRGLSGGPRGQGATAVSATSRRI
jgi:hypothetical protein